MLRYDIHKGVNKIRTKTTTVMLAVSLGLSGLGLALAFPLSGSAAGNPNSGFKHATGNIYMSTPSQQATFTVFDYGVTGDRGSVTYSNFEYPTADETGYLRYTAPIICASVDSTNRVAAFTFQIPGGFPGLSGLYVYVQVTDGGSAGAGHDTWGHTVVSDPAQCDTGGSVGIYLIVAGNLVVHKN